MATGRDRGVREEKSRKEEIKTDVYVVDGRPDRK